MEKKFLKRKVKSYQPENKEIQNILEDLTNLGFQGKNLGVAYKIWEKMLTTEKITIFLGLAGALVPAGMRKTIVYLIKNRFIDCIVSTGANLFHDCHETLKRFHYQGNPYLPDEELHKCGIDRIYDVLAKEEEFRKTEDFITQFSNTLPENKCYSSREFLYLLGEYLKKRSKEEGILTSAAKYNVPIYCPAIADSSLGIALFDLRYKFNKKIVIDVIADVKETGDIVKNSSKTGVIYLGGGVPKNFIQQAALVPAFQMDDDFSHKYAIQITTDMPVWGGLSGCTFEEAKSWGKIAEDANTVTLNCDSTIALPILVSALDKIKEKFKSRKKPYFLFGEKISIEYR
jgi:deoxyhypusine synthase